MKLHRRAGWRDPGSRRAEALVMLENGTEEAGVWPGVAETQCRRPTGGEERQRRGLSFQRKFPPLSVAIGYGPDHPRASREVLRRQGARF